MPDQSLLCGVAGVGHLGQHHARLYREVPDAKLAGVYDVNPARAAEIAQLYGCPAFATLEELGDACDVVSVAVPLLARGCHLLIEKPLCASLAEAEQILAAAHTAGVLVQVGHIEHFNPVMGFLEREVVAPRYILAERLAPFQPRGTEVGRRPAHRGHCAVVPTSPLPRRCPSRWPRTLQ